VSVARYSTIVVLGVAATLAALLLGLRDRLASADVVAVLIGAVLAGSNSVAAYALVAWSAGRSTAWFFRAILGGMLARMTFMLAAVVGGILAVGLPRVPLVFSLLAYFVALLIFELAVVARRLARPASRAEAT
jgi:hypothetical protein